jgi:hypothetical protein
MKDAVHIPPMPNNIKVLTIRANDVIQLGKDDSRLLCTRLSPLRLNTEGLSPGSS